MCLCLPCGKQLAVEALCWQLWGAWNWKPCQSIPTLGLRGDGGKWWWLVALLSFQKDLFLECFQWTKRDGISPPVLRSTEGRGNSNLQKPKLNMTYDNSLLYGPEIQRHTSLKKCPEKRSLIQVDLNCTSNVALPLIASFTVWHKTN